MNQQSFVCIVCPKGCKLLVKEMDDKVIVEGNLCQRGKTYGIKEAKHPERIVTSTVRINHPLYRRLPVVTKGGVPKEMIFKVMEEINKQCVDPPIEMGHVIIENILNTGVNLVASKHIR